MYPIDGLNVNLGSLFDSVVMARTKYEFFGTTPACHSYSDATGQWSGSGCEVGFNLRRYETDC